jgi:hypothetical protein
MNILSRINTIKLLLFNSHTYYILFNLGSTLLGPIGDNNYFLNGYLCHISSNFGKFLWD